MKNLKKCDFLLIFTIGLCLPPSVWADSLYDLAAAFLPPPNHPLGGQQLWSVDVSDPSVQCLDGSTPRFYVDGAINGASDKWVFYIQGGHTCSEAQDCADAYANPADRRQMSSHWAPQSITGGGILNPDPLNQFADYNRIKIHKCSFDGFLGNTSRLGLSVTSPGGVVIGNLDLFHHGREIYKAVLQQLASGLSYNDETCPTGGPCMTLEPLTNAETIIFTGASGGGAGTIHGVDDLADEVRAMKTCLPLPLDDQDVPAACEVDIRAVIDARFKPSLENERNRSLNLGLPLNIMEYNSTVTGLVEQTAIGPFIYKPPTGPLFLHNETLRQDRDLSCEATHGINSPYCEDVMHVLAEHVQTPFFIHQDLEDSNHLDQGAGWIPLWAYNTAFAGFFDPNLPALSGDYSERLIEQSAGYSGKVVDGIPVHILAPTCRRHVTIVDTQAFANEQIIDLSTGISVSYHDALLDWVDNLGVNAVIAVDDGVNYDTFTCF